MFDNVKFEGTINLGAVVVAIVQLLSSLAVYYRVRALMLERGIKLPWPIKSKTPPPPADPGQPPPADPGQSPPADPGPVIPKV